MIFKSSITSTPCDTYTLQLGDIYVRCQKGGIGIFPKLSLCFALSLDNIFKANKVSKYSVYDF